MAALLFLTGAHLGLCGIADAFESERSEYISKLGDVQPSFEEMHKLRWELQERNKEVMELQKSLSDAKVNHTQERGIVLKIQAENDDLRHKMLENTKLHEHLLSLNEHELQEVVFQPGERPHILSKPASKPRSIPHRNDENDKSVANRGHRGVTVDSIAPGQKLSVAAPKVQVYNALDSRSGRITAPRLLRTVHYPSEKNDALQSVIEALQNQIQSEREWYDHSVVEMTSDREAREQQFELARKMWEGKSDEYVAALQEMERKYNLVMSDYLSLRHNSQLVLRAATEEREAIVKERDVWKERYNNLYAGMKQEVVTEEALREHVGATTERERQLQYALELLTKKESYLTGMMKENEGKHKMEVSTLRDQLKDLRAKYNRLEERRNLENEGWQVEVGQLRQVQHELNNTVYELTRSVQEDEEVSYPTARNNLIRSRAVVREMA